MALDSIPLPSFFVTSKYLLVWSLDIVDKIYQDIIILIETGRFFKFWKIKAKSELYIMEFVDRKEELEELQRSLNQNKLSFTVI